VSLQHVEAVAISAAEHILIETEKTAAAVPGEIAFDFEPKVDTSSISAAVAAAELEVARCRAAAQLLEADLPDCSSSDDGSSSDDSAYGQYEGHTAPAPAVSPPAEPPVVHVPAVALASDCAVAPAVNDQVAQAQAQDVAVVQKRNTLLHLIQEILRTEDDFQININFAICKPLFFLQAQLLDIGSDNGFGEDDIQLLKCNLQEICHCSMKFLKELESANNLAASGSPLLFGHIFKSFIPKFLEIYSRYCANFEEYAVEILQKLAEANIMDLLPAHHIQELEESEEWRKGGRSLQSLLIKPVQRLPRYVDSDCCDGKSVTL